jgi:hypothetical protein
VKGRIIGALLAAGMLLASLAGCGNSDAEILDNAKPVIANVVLGFMTTQVSDPEVDTGTLEVQIALYPKAENDARARGICRELARQLRATNGPLPDLIQIYGINGDYWLQCNQDGEDR